MLGQGHAKNAVRVFAAFLIVLSAVGGGFSPVGAAQAQTQECTVGNFVDEVIELFTLQGPIENCGADNSELTTSTDYYQQAQAVKSTSDGYLTAQTNYGNETDAMLWTDAKMRIVEGLNDGNTSAVVKSEANATIRDRTAIRQSNLINQWNAYVAQLEYLYAQNQTVLTGYQGANITGFATVNVTLADGSEIGVRGPVEGDRHVNPFYVDTGTTGAVIADLSSARDFTYGVTAITSSSRLNGGLTYEGPSSDLTDITNTLQNYRWGHVFYESNRMADRLTTNVDAYVDEVYAAYQAGELSLNETISPVELASRASTDKNSTGYYGFASAELASLGFSTDLNQSFTVTWNDTTTEQTFNGTLFYTGDDVTQFEAGTTYDTSTLNGTFLMTRQGPNGTAYIQELSPGTVTIDSMTNARTGEATNTTTVVDYTSESFDATQLQAELDRLAELRGYYERQQDTAGTGISLGTEDKAIIAIVAIALILVATRN
jgi:hypothetical protein